MAEKFQNRYRIPSTRMQNWDYRWNASYFVTICTHNREHYFGKIVDRKMQLSAIGIIADVLWHEIKNHSKNVELDAFVVMPNHVHGILVLNNGDNGDGDNRDDADGVGVDVETLHATSLSNQPIQPPTNEFYSSISPKPGSVSTIIRSYKSAVTKHAHRLGFNFEWQTRFHDHIIRDNESYQRIKTYIIENPLKWVDDKFYKL